MADKHAADIISEIDKYLNTKKVDDNSEAIPDYIIDSNLEMAEYEIGGRKCIGILEMDDLALRLPILGDLSYPNLTVSPCRYRGSVYTDDMILAAHNYRNHFGRIRELQVGAVLKFIDMNGTVFEYKVTGLEQIDGGDVSEMVLGNWDLTLFTCTWNGRERVTIRCEKIEK